MPGRFDHEKLKVYQLSIDFVAWAQDMAEKAKLSGPLRDQLDRASSSIPLNIAEGNGKYSKRDRCRFLEVARGSALECAACLDVIVARMLLTPDAVAEGKGLLLRVVSLLTSLIAAVSERAREEEGVYEAGLEHGPDQEHG